MAATAVGRYIVPQRRPKRNQPPYVIPQKRKALETSKSKEVSSSQSSGKENNSNFERYFAGPSFWYASPPPETAPLPKKLLAAKKKCLEKKLPIAPSPNSVPLPTTLLDRGNEHKKPEVAVQSTLPPPACATNTTASALNLSPTRKVIWKGVIIRATVVTINCCVVGKLFVFCSSSCIVTAAFFSFSSDFYVIIG